MFIRDSITEPLELSRDQIPLLRVICMRLRGLAGSNIIGCSSASRTGWLDAFVVTCKKVITAEEQEVAEGEHGGASREQGGA